MASHLQTLRYLQTHPPVLSPVGWLDQLSPGRAARTLCCSWQYDERRWRVRNEPEVKVIERVSVYKYLGFLLDENLSFKHHIECLMKKNLRVKLGWDILKWITCQVWNILKVG